MENVQYHECNNLQEVQSATSTLDKAKEVPIKIDDGGVIKDVKEWKGIYNISQGKFSAAVISYYNVIQHKEYFDAFAQAMDRLNVKYKMIIKQAGNRAFADIQFEGRNIKFKKLNEEFVTGIRLMNGYNGKTGLLVSPMFTRLACLNGMIITRTERSFSVRHHSKMLQEVETFVEKRLNELINKYDDLQAWVSGAMADSKEWTLCCNIIAKMIPIVKHREQVLKNLGIDIVIKTDKAKKKTFNYIWHDDKLKKEKFTRWEVYNAVTSYLSHGKQITPQMEDWYHRKADKLLLTPLNKMPIIEVKI